MSNLLFISDNPKAEYIKTVIQPVIKVMINVVTDFDHGLKNVFEKRPSIVCIQDQIGGVTGENVARHIQMLLGNSAPKFILLLTGNSKARLIKGLYEHIVDLSLSNETVAEDVTNILKALLGEQWERIYIPPKLTPALVRSSVVVSEDPREDVVRLPEKPLPSIQTSAFPATSAIISASAADTGEAARITTADISGKSERVAKSNHTVEPQVAQSQVPRSAPPEPSHLVDIWRGSGSAETPQPELSATKQPLPVLPTTAPSEISFNVTPLVKPTAGASENSWSQTAGTAISKPFQEPEAPESSEFKIEQFFPLDDKPIFEGMIPDVEESYRSTTPNIRRSFVIAALSAICIGVWSLVVHEMQTPTLPEQPVVSAEVKKQTTETTLPAISVPTPEPSQSEKPPAVLPPQVQPQAATPPVPSFVPKEGHDPAYSANKPGWERYVGTTTEFRVYSDSGHLCAVQALALKGVPLSKKLLKTALEELTGSSDYRITSSILKAGVRIESGTIRDEYEIKLYRKRGALVAFVVSIKN